MYLKKVKYYSRPVEYSLTSIGNMEYIGPDWKKVYDKTKDPDFRIGLPWETKGVDYDESYLIPMPDGSVKFRIDKTGKRATLFSNWTIKYGFITADITVPIKRGGWAAFWLFGDNGMPELDVVEHIGASTAAMITHHFGYRYKKGYKRQKGKKRSLLNNRGISINHLFSSKPKSIRATYSVEMLYDRTIYRVNGKKVLTIRRDTSSSDKHVVLNLAYNGNPELAEEQEMIVHSLKVIKYV